MANSSIISLDEQTADGILHTGPTRVAAVQIITDGTNPADVILYDNTSAAGVKVFEGGVAGTTRSMLFDLPRPVKCKNGIYLDITGTGASCIVYTG